MLTPKVCMGWPLCQRYLFIVVQDLQIVKDLLGQRLGPDFVRSALGDQDNYVAARVRMSTKLIRPISKCILQVVRDLSARPPSAATLDNYLYSIAQASGVHWVPDFQPHEKWVVQHHLDINEYKWVTIRVDQISAMLDPASMPVVDILRLRMLCSHGKYLF